LVSVPLFYAFYGVDRVRNGATVESNFTTPVASAILRHNLFYATSGVLGGIDVDQIEVFRPCLPVFPLSEVMSGCDVIYSVGDGFVLTDARGQRSSNVYTLFGDVALRGGLIGVVVIGLSLGFVASTAVEQALRAGRGSTRALAAVMLLPLLFGWFGNYVDLSGWTELVFWCSVLIIIERTPLARASASRPESVRTLRAMSTPSPASPRSYMQSRGDVQI
jgi:hypothetical protein